MNRALARLAVGALPLLMASAAVVSQEAAQPEAAQHEASQEEGAQEEGAFDRTPRSCIQVISIDQTKAVDDQNIIFRMRGNKAYRNHLPRRCPGLERENRFSYKVYSGRLCSVDTITVLERYGVGFQPGFTCGLGEFVPLSPEEIEDLERDEDDQPGQSAIEAESVDIQQTAEPPEGAEPEPAEPGKTDE